MPATHVPDSIDMIIGPLANVSMHVHPEWFHDGHKCITEVSDLAGVRLHECNGVETTALSTVTNLSHFYYNRIQSRGCKTILGRNFKITRNCLTSKLLLLFFNMMQIRNIYNNLERSYPASPNRHQRTLVSIPINRLPSLLTVSCSFACHTIRKCY